MQAWVSFIASWLPLLLLIVFWFYFWKNMKPSRHGQLIERTFEHYDRVEKLLERIAVGVERGVVRAPGATPDDISSPSGRPDRG